MRVKKEYYGKKVILSLEGELVGIYALRLQEDIKQLLSEGINYIIFDLAKVTSLDSIGVMTLTCLKGNHVKLSYHNFPEQLQEIFALDQGGKYRKFIKRPGMPWTLRVTTD